MDLNRINIVRGDTQKLRFEIINPADKSPVDLTAYETIRFTIKRSTQDTDAAAVWQGSLAASDITIDGTVTAHNVIHVVVPAEVTAKIRFGRLYYWDVQIADTDDNKFTPLSGTILATPDVSLG